VTDNRQARAILRLLSFIEPTAAEIDFLASIPGREVQAKPNEVVCSGDEGEALYLLLDGWAASAMISAEGDERINSINLAGDMLGMASFVMATPFDRTYALTPVTLRPIHGTTLREIFEHFPRLAATILLVAQEERAAKNEWNCLHSASAERRLAGFLFRIGEGLEKLNGASGGAMSVPLRQRQVAEVIGVTPVYIHRLIQKFVQGGLIESERGSLRIADIDGLQKLAGLPRWKVVAPRWLPEPA